MTDRSCEPSSRRHQSPHPRPQTIDGSEVRVVAVDVSTRPRHDQKNDPTSDSSSCSMGRGWGCHDQRRGERKFNSPQPWAHRRHPRIALDLASSLPFPPHSCRRSVGENHNKNTTKGARGKCERKIHISSFSCWRSGKTTDWCPLSVVVTGWVSFVCSYE